MDGLLRDEERRRRIADAGHEEVMNAHTWRVRAWQLRAALLGGRPRLLETVE